MKSRVHRLKTFDQPGVRAYVKRDDELSFGVSGSKLRKYASLLPYLKEQNTKEAVLISNSLSNHSLSLSQLLVENEIRPVLFLNGPPPERAIGNFLFTSLFVAPEDIHWVPKESRALEARAYAEKKGAFLIPMGACMKESVLGVHTLVDDILRNEAELGITFDHLFLDSGTGMTASTVILRFAELQKNTHIHVIQMAGTKEEFSALVQHSQFPLHYTLYQPREAPSFASTNRAVWDSLLHMARYEGILVDPIYNAKLFGEGRILLQEGKIQGNVLFVHSGGCLALAGFMEELSQYIQN